MTSETSRRYGRVLAEGTTIVASVLLAFAIQAWWERRSEYKEDVRLLSAVLDEMRTNLAAIDANRAFHLGVVDVDTTLLKLAGVDPSALAPQYADSLIAGLSWWNGSNSWTTGAVTALVGAGRLSAIQDETLRRRLAEWPKRIDMLRAAEDQEYDFFFTVFMPYIRREASLPQISDAIRFRPGSSQPYEVGRLNHAPVHTDHRRLIVSREFQNMVLHQRWIQDDILDWYDIFAKDVSQIIVALEAELTAR